MRAENTFVSQVVGLEIPLHNEQCAVLDHALDNLGVGGVGEVRVDFVAGLATAAALQKLETHELARGSVVVLV